MVSPPLYRILLSNGEYHLAGKEVIKLITDETQYKMDYVARSIKNAFFLSQKAHRTLLDHLDDIQKEAAAVAYLNKAIAVMASAQAVYVSAIEDTVHELVDRIFNEFDTFSDEFLNNYATNHSHQWTDIEFERFMDAVQGFSATHIEGLE